MGGPIVDQRSLLKRPQSVRKRSQSVREAFACVAGVLLDGYNRTGQGWAGWDGCRWAGLG